MIGLIKSNFISSFGNVFSKTPSIMGKLPIFSFQNKVFNPSKATGTATSLFKLEAASSFLKGSWQYRLQQIGLLTGFVLLGAGSATWVAKKTITTGERIYQAGLDTGNHIYQSGLLDINVINLCKWIQRTTPTEKELGNALTLSIEKGHFECIKYLMQLPEFANIPQTCIDEAFKAATQQNHPRYLELLLESEHFSNISPKVYQEVLTEVIGKDKANFLAILLGLKKIEKDFPYTTTKNEPSLLHKIIATPMKLEQFVELQADICNAQYADFTPEIALAIKTLATRALNILHVMEQIPSKTGKCAKSIGSFGAFIAGIYLDLFKELITNLKEVETPTPPSKEEWMSLVKEEWMSLVQHVSQQGSRYRTSFMNTLLRVNSLEPNDSTTAIELGDAIGKALGKTAEALWAEPITTTLLLNYINDAIIQGMNPAAELRALSPAKKEDNLSQKITNPSSPQNNSSDAFWNAVQAGFTSEIVSAKKNTPTNKWDLSFRELIKNNAPECAKVFMQSKYLSTKTPESLGRSLLDGIMSNNMGYVKSLIQSENFSEIPKSYIEKACSDAVLFGRNEILELLLALDCLSPECLGKMLQETMTYGNKKIVTLLLQSPHFSKIPQSYLQAALLEAAQQPNSKFMQLLLESNSLSKKPEELSNLLRTLVLFGFTKPLKVFMESEYYTQIPFENLYKIAEEAALSDHPIKVRLLMSSSHFSQVSDQQVKHLTHIISANKKDLLNDSTTPTNPFSDIEYAEKALNHLAIYGKKESLEGFMQLDTFSNIPFKSLSIAVQQAISEGNLENATCLMQNVQFSKGPQEEIEELRQSLEKARLTSFKGIYSLTLPHATKKMPTSFWQPIASSLYSIGAYLWTSSIEDLKKPPL